MNLNSRLDFFSQHLNSAGITFTLKKIIVPLFLTQTMKAKLILVVLTLLLVQCRSQKKSESLVGNWKVDSIYSYYNGFSFTRKDVADQPLLGYQPEGKLMMSMSNESRLFSYELSAQDTLVHRNADDKILDKFIVLKLDAHHLILRKETPPLFKGNNQVRYEVRYLSKQKSE